MSLSLYPIKYLSELYWPYFSFSETSILSTSILFILIFFVCFCYCRSHFFWFFCRRNLCYFHLFLYSVKKKSKIFLIIIIGICALIIHFCFVLIDSINVYRNVYYHNNDVCLEICMMVFMRIISMWWFFVWKEVMWRFFIQIAAFKTYC